MSPARNGPLQDLLIYPDRRRSGLGRSLAKTLFDAYSDMSRARARTPAVNSSKSSLT